MSTRVLRVQRFSPAISTTPSGTEPRAGGQLAFHVLEVMESVLESAALGQSVKVASRCERPEAVPLTDLSGPSGQQASSA